MPTKPTDPAAAELAAVQRADETPTDPALAVPVRVDGPVTVTERPARSITTDQLAVGMAPVFVVNAVPSRARLRLTARGAAVFIGRESVTTGTGYMLAPGESVDLSTRGAVFAVAAIDGASLHVLSELNEG